jgi:hypothetical protein
MAGIILSGYHINIIETMHTVRALENAKTICISGSFIIIRDWA